VQIYYKNRNVNYFKFLWYGILLVFNSNYRPTAQH